MSFFDTLFQNLSAIEKGDMELSEFYSLLWKNSSLLNSDQFTEILILVKKIPHSAEANSWHALSEGVLFSFSPNMGNPLQKVTEVLELFRNSGDISGEGAALSMLIVYYKNLGQLDKAQANVEEALKKIGTNNFYHFFLSITYYQAGELHHLLKDYDAAINYFNKGISITTNGQRMAARSFNGIANVYRDADQFDLAFDYFQKSLKVSKENNDFLLESKNYADIGNYYFLQNNFEKALEYQQKSLKLRLDNKLNIPIATNYIELAGLFLKQNKLEEALDYALKAEQVATTLNIVLKLFQVHHVLSSIYEAMGNFGLALEHFKKYNDFKETVLNQESSRKIKQISMNHEVETAEKEKEIFKLRNVELKGALDDIEASVRYARRIQEAILPPSHLIKRFLPDSFIIFKPKDIVAGDFYWLEHLNDLTIFAAADCTGHGVPGAMVSVVCSNALNRSVKEYHLTEPAQILNKTRALIIEQFRKCDEDVKDGMDISLCALNTKTNVLNWAGANNPLWIIRTGELTEYKPDKQPVGNYPDVSPFTNHVIQLLKGDRIYIFSDGYADQFGGEKGKKFKISAMKEFILSVQHKTMNEQQQVITEKFNNWKGELDQVDDVCIIGLQHN